MFEKVNESWFSILIVLAILMITIIWYKRQDLSAYHEGFTQNDPYLFKSGVSVYDDFYAQIYNKLMYPDNRCDFQIETIIEMTQPSIQSSTFLDIASGTGEISKKLSERGYDVYSIDESQDMVNYVQETCPKVHSKCGNAKEPIHYEKASFSHAICNGLGLYLFEDKNEFFRNCFFWLKSGGYLILHCVDPMKFDTIVPAGRPPLFENPQQFSQTRITKSAINFGDFSYKGGYDFSKDGEVVFRESFTDGLTKNVREQETVYYMEPLEDIMKIASYNGFILKGQVNFSQVCGDEYQYLVILERMQ